MKTTKLWLVTIATLLCNITVTAATEFTVNGIEYTIASIDGTCSVSGYNGFGTDVVIPSSVDYRNRTFSVTSIGYEAFSNCSSLTSITIPESVTSIGSNAFEGCRIKRVTFNCASVESWFSKMTTLTTVVLGGSVTSIGNEAFSGCSSLTSINIPESVTSIGISAFEGCSSLTSITIPEGVTSIGGSAFYNCSSLTSITIPEGMTSIGDWAFSYCTSLTSITIPEGVTSIGIYAFNYCSSLTSITIPESVTSIGFYAFNYCSSLTSIIIPESVTSIGSEAFSGCRIKHVTFNCASVGSWFSKMTTLTTVVLGGSVTSIGISAFSGCSSLTSINIPESVKTIGPYAFYGCRSLTAITIPESVTRIYYGAFENCRSLTSISCLARIPPTIDISAFDNDAYNFADLLVPQGTKDAYQAADGWKSFWFIKEIVEVATYTLTFMVDGEVYHTVELPCEATITMPATPTKEGHTFSGWGEVPETMPAHDVTLNGTFTVNKYLVTFKVDGEIVYSESLEYGASIVAPEAPEKEGYTFNGWGEVDATVPAHDVTYEADYSVNSYQLTYVVDGETVQTESVAYGTAITLIDEPVKEGHTFSGWGEVPETMPAEDVTISGTFTVNKYLVTFKIDGAMEYSYSIAYGETITLITAPEKEGYTFSGWGEVPETMPAHDVILYAVYTANIYKVYYFVGATLVHTAEVAYGEAIPEYIYEPTAEGDVFLGWVGESYETMPAHDVTYTANIDDAIEQLTIDKSQLTIYDLKGRKVTDTENLKGGIYIVNGKKVVIK